MNTHVIGVQGENIAADYLRKNGYKILERNFSCKFGEIDIIAIKDNFYVFIEVKSRSTVAFGRPCEAVTPYKQQRIVAAAKYWLCKQRKTGLPVRFDIVEILDGKTSVIVDAFR